MRLKSLLKRKSETSNWELQERHKTDTELLRERDEYVGTGFSSDVSDTSSPNELKIDGEGQVETHGAGGGTTRGLDESKIKTRNEAKFPEPGPRMAGGATRKEQSTAYTDLVNEETDGSEISSNDDEKAIDRMFRTLNKKRSRRAYRGRRLYLEEFDEIEEPSYPHAKCPISCWGIVRFLRWADCKCCIVRSKPRARRMKI